MAYRAAILSFSKGEISKELEARFDLSAYQAGLREALNVKIERVGGVSKRMGTRFVAEAMSTDSRLIGFQWSDSQAYVLEFGQALMRPLALGGVVLEDTLKVQGITNDQMALITVPFHAYSVGDPVYLTDQLGMTEINDKFLTVGAVVDANHFRVNFDAREAGVWTGDASGTVRTGAPSAPPTAPTVPAPIVPPDPPATGSGGDGGYVPDGDGGTRWERYFKTGAY